jgi:tetratricopeptide (TPR) repeat protein
MTNDTKKSELLNPLEAAHYLGITSELLFQYTKAAFEKASKLSSLRTMDISGATKFSKFDLDSFNKTLSGEWPCEGDGRPSIPKAILDHLRAESANQCARCGSGIGVETAHIIPWSKGRSHHHENLIRICTSCHREHDIHGSLPTKTLRDLKNKLVERTRQNISQRMYSPLTDYKLPQPKEFFFGRHSELSELIEALRAGRSTIVTGVGGIGKTQLLLQGLHKAGLGRPIFWIDAEAYRSAADIQFELQALVTRNEDACSETDVAKRLDSLQACVVFDGVDRALDDLDAFEDLLSSLLDATLFTQFVLTSQVPLYGIDFDTRLRIGRLDYSASKKLLDRASQSDRLVTNENCGALLEFCDGHALTVRIAAALRDYYGGAARALDAIRSGGVDKISFPTRRANRASTSLQLCLRAAYEALTDDARELLWALSESPAGILTHYLEGGWLELIDPIESLGELRRWHLIEIAQNQYELTRTKVLNPIRAFATEAARTNESERYGSVIDRLSLAHQMMVAVLETKYSSADDTPYVVDRYEQEIPNFLRLLELARSNRENTVLGSRALSITRAMMRYFFVRRLPEQGARAMNHAAELAIEIGESNAASALILQLVSLAARACDPELLEAGYELAKQLERQSNDTGTKADIALCRAVVARDKGNYADAEKFARSAYASYCRQLRTTIANRDEITRREGGEIHLIDEIHNDISHALELIGFLHLHQERYAEAKKVYYHALRHERGSSVGVNRGQTLHQIGNCECNLGRFSEATMLYIEAAETFRFVGMEEYLSNAIGELGFALLDVQEDERLLFPHKDTVRDALSDVVNDIGRTFDPDNSIDHARAIVVLRKSFGCIILSSLSGYGDILGEFCIAIKNERTLRLNEQIEKRDSDSEESFPLVVLDWALRLGFFASEAERLFPTEGDITDEVINELLLTVCTAHPWARSELRFIDWLSAYLTRRWSLVGASPNRLHEFIQNYDDDVVDYLDLSRIGA